MPTGHVGPKEMTHLSAKVHDNFSSLFIVPKGTIALKSMAPATTRNDQSHLTRESSTSSANRAGFRFIGAPMNR
ncbi:MAG: hypothetical protein WB007_13160, partial [Candidatus Acidiferrales bacterium]